jgi:hypothetical protein
MMYVGPRYDEKGRFTLSVYLNTGVRQLWHPNHIPPAASRATRRRGPSDPGPEGRRGRSDTHRVVGADFMSSSACAAVRPGSESGSGWLSRPFISVQSDELIPALVLSRLARPRPSERL